MTLNKKNDVSEDIIGIIFAFFSLAEFITALVLDKFIHKPGMKKKFMLVGIAITFFG